MKTLAHVVLFSLLTGTTIGATFHVDDFEDGTTLGWSGSGPTVIPTGGPNGVNDAFLQVISNGANGPGSRAAVFNTFNEWVGDIGALGATAIEFDMVNFDTSASDLFMRIVLFGPSSTNNRWTSANPQTIPNDGIWRHYSFSLNEPDLTIVQGDSTYHEAIADVVRVMFRHDSGTPSSVGTPIAATFGVDNIALVGGTGVMCDFGNDGVCNANDIDALMAVVAAGTNDQGFDLTMDGLVNDADRDAWLRLAGSENGLAAPYLVGDANLDGVANAQDLNALALNWQSDNTSWTGGNFTGSGSNAGDLNALALHWQQDVPRAAEFAAVPEPSGRAIAVWLILCFFAVAGRHGSVLTNRIT